MRYFKCIYYPITVLCWVNYGNSAGTIDLHNTCYSITGQSDCILRHHNPLWTIICYFDTRHASDAPFMIMLSNCFMIGATVLRSHPWWDNDSIIDMNEINLMRSVLDSDSSLAACTSIFDIQWRSKTLNINDMLQ